MKKTTALLTFLAICPQLSRAELINFIPGANDQGGMIMPMVTIRNADDYNNPTTGDIAIDFNPESVPLLRSLQELNAGSWFPETAAWRPDIGSPEGVGGTPPANAGNGDLFNSQYGFMFMSMPMMGSANLPEGKSLAIRLAGFSSAAMRSFNYVNSQNRWDPIFDEPDFQVLWSGSMWHNFFTLPADAPAGFYTATFEIFIVDQPFTSGTGFADYTAAGRQAERDLNFASASVEYTFQVLGPEGITFAGWLDKSLNEDELSQAERTDPKGDPGDYGIPNLLRYAFDLDARSPARTGLPEAGLEIEAESGNMQVTIAFTRQTNALDLQYQVQGSHDLAEWVALEGGWVTEVAPHEGGLTERVTMLDSHPIDAAKHYFLRVMVELNNEK